ncbi:fructose-1,6-bisphosphate aldolase/phosphatase [Anaeromyxobacter oryzae]|uniref:Fructose-1,6-bisphosphate aldolase/phosphatase n=1 Tax=Anaeromyxobacter oryzae TaxID=2918170 RepID=A0ABM7WRZ6_9BACT|nr:fructose-1,6-bisphosphate aldolase/phosphatase [Anaeromyxobacter oryzae]BDG02256.1 fructose 1,6-bisphosphatase [Anaeromyxobacter oryzae]
MNLTITVIKADIGSIGGHLVPSTPLVTAVEEHVRGAAAGLLLDFHVGHTGDDVAILMTHTRGTGDPYVHRVAWDAFLAGTAVAKGEGLYGAGQDLLKESFSGNVRGMGPAVAEMTVAERAAEPFLLFAADKTDPGAFNLPLYLAFADPMNTPGLLLAPKMAKGFRFVVMDVAHVEGDRIIELQTPEDLYDLAALLRDPERYVVESVWSRATGDQAAVVATSRLHNIAGKYTGKDDPVMLVRCQMQFPATGEVLAPFQIGHFVAGGMRGSHNMPLMPVTLGSPVSYFDGPPIVTCGAYSVRNGVLTGPVDPFAHPFWDAVRTRVAEKAVEMRRQGFFGAAMLPMSELEYTGIMEKLAELDRRFRLRPEERHQEQASVVTAH